MDKFTLRQLRYFEAVALHQHFGRAAAASSISQPAISVQIKELEEGIGQTLFDRTTRQITLTPFGEVFAVRTREILRAIDDLSDLARASDNHLVGTLRLGVIPTIGPYLLPKIVNGFNATFPQVELRIRERQTEKLLQDLHNGLLDAALLALPVSEPGLEETTLFKERFVLIREKGDASQPVPNGPSLAQMRLLLLEEGHCFRDQALDFCGPPVTRINEDMDASSLTTLVQMVASGLGITLIPEMAVSLETNATEVSVSRFPEPEPTRTIGLIWRRNSPLAKHLGSVSDCIKSIAHAI